MQTSSCPVMSSGTQLGQMRTSTRVLLTKRLSAEPRITIATSASMPRCCGSPFTAFTCDMPAQSIATESLLTSAPTLLVGDNRLHATHLLLSLWLIRARFLLLCSHRRSVNPMSETIRLLVPHSSSNGTLATLLLKFAWQRIAACKRSL